jgi:hypothetical protein
LAQRVQHHFTNKREQRGLLPQGEEALEKTMASTATFGTTPQSGLSASEHSRQLRKAVIASTIGTTIEWYDFFIYGTAAGLIFGKLYFPNEDPLTATLAAFGTYFIGFASRPIGAAIFGHYGDRIGRKGTLIARASLLTRRRARMQHHKL